MGLFDLLRGGKQADEITRAFIGAYVFSRLRDDDQRQTITLHIYRMLCESGPLRISFDDAQDKFNSSPPIVQSGLIVNAMIDLRIHHGVRGFQWDYIPNPFALTVYSERAIKTAISNVRKYGIDPEECFSGPAEI